MNRLDRIIMTVFIAVGARIGAQQPAAPEGEGGSPPPGERSRAALSYAQLDLNGDGGVTWDEFLRAHARAAGRPEDKAAAVPAKEMTRMRRIFREADKDKSGILTQKEWDEYPRK